MFFEIQRFSKSFGALQAVYDVSFGLKEGQIVSVIGPNGAGKTTLFNLITGVLKPDEGDIFFKGRRITNKSPHQLCRLGLARSFQVTNIFQGLSVFENIRLACQGRTTGLHLFSSVKELPQPIEEAEKILNLLGLWEQRDDLAGNLSHGDQRYLEIGMTLAVQPSMILLDEPTAGMTPLETRATIDLINKQLKGRITILLIEHDIDLVFAVSDWITVMNQGMVLTQGPPEDVRANEEVQKAYFGEKDDAEGP